MQKIVAGWQWIDNDNTDRGDYGLHTINNRKELWQELQTIATQMSGPRVMMGDFNPILSMEDRLYGNPVQEVEVISRNSCSNLWPHLEGVIMDTYFSDHYPLRIPFEIVKETGTKTFKFFNYLVEHQDFMQAMETSWRKPSNLHSMQMAWLKFKQLNGEMKRLVRREPGKVEDRIAQAREKLKTIQIQMRDPARSLELVQVEAKAKEELEKWLMVEESIASKNLEYSEEEIQKFYKGFLGQVAHQLPVVQQDIMQSGKVVTRDQQLKLIRPITKEEVNGAIKGIGDQKAPRCDGFNAFFYKRTWPVIGEDVTFVVIEFFNSGSMLIGDNIIMAHELVNGYERKDISPGCMLKIDMRKAYDSLEYPYLQQILRLIGFPEIFVAWIMECITTVTYSIIINGKPLQLFAVRKELRQDNPLSPYLFVLGMEYLSRLMKTLKTIKGFRYHPRCAKFNLVQLGFVDDLLQFCRGDVQSVHALHDKFQMFSKVLGLIANPNKSSIYFGGVCQNSLGLIMEALNFRRGELPISYSRMPLSTKRLSILQCEPFIEKMMEKITSWTTKFLSYAGRTQLILSVLYVIQTFWAQVFILPKKACPVYRDNLQKVPMDMHC
ncbi:PREDICTED: uncharacterized protein LOC109239938 [Nicotiana attenuata]|uniref:uncharacterized protein LOC109239938 n=1 Tax=Nicotiana attenuata TaxID=49451 RepID=UPI0009052AB0|nr:PREDICTED: uncharacterized protein LOC109239938 [Nicotiana attenuata]